MDSVSAKTIFSKRSFLKLVSRSIFRLYPRHNGASCFTAKFVWHFSPIAVLISVIILDASFSKLNWNCISYHLISINHIIIVKMKSSGKVWILAHSLTDSLLYKSSFPFTNTLLFSSTNFILEACGWHGACLPPACIVNDGSSHPALGF